MNLRSDVTFTHVALTPFTAMRLLSIDCNLLVRVAKLKDFSKILRAIVGNCKSTGELQVCKMWMIKNKFNFN